MLTFVAQFVSADHTITASHAKNINVKMSYLKKTPPVTTSSLAKAATSCAPCICRSILLVDGVSFVILDVT